VSNIGETRRPALGPRLAELVQDQSGNEVERGLAPVISGIDPLPFRVAQGERDILSVRDLVRRAEAHLLKEIEPGAARNSTRFPAYDYIASVLGPPSGGHLPQLALFVVDKAARRPGKQCRNDISNTFAAARRGNDDGVLGTVVTEVIRAASGVRPAANIDTGAGVPAARQ
jgi:hypothetical protein